MKIKADLHTHTYCSDGQFSPRDNVIMAKKAGLKYMAVSDHDTLSGIAEAVKAGDELGIIVIKSIELSCYNGYEVHILGYGIDCDNVEFLTKLNKVRDGRSGRTIEILAKLKDNNVNISLEELHETYKDSTIGRKHIAELMVVHGYCKSVNDAFNNYLGIGRCAYVSSDRLSPKAGIELIKLAGGVPVLAHPNQMKLSRSMTEKYIEELVSYGLMGIESYYFTHNDEDIEVYESIAKKYNLLSTAGSDFHGEGRANVLGQVPRDMEQSTLEFLAKGR